MNTNVCEPLSYWVRTVVAAGTDPLLVAVERPCVAAALAVSIWVDAVRYAVLVALPAPVAIVVLPLHQPSSTFPSSASGSPDFGSMSAG